MTSASLFVSLEGIDGCGKSTQLQLLAERLRATGREVLVTAEPGGTPIGQSIRRILLDPAHQELSPTAELLLYFAARAQNADQWIVPALQAGRIVLSDRFTDSTLAYQGAARGLGEEVVQALDRIACRGLAPAVTLLIDIDVETSFARTGARAPADRMDAQTTEFRRRVREAYLQIAAREPGRVRVIDGRGSVTKVADAVWQSVSERL